MAARLSCHVTRCACLSEESKGATTPSSCSNEASWLATNMEYRGVCFVFVGGFSFSKRRKWAPDSAKRTDPSSICRDWVSPRTLCVFCSPADVRFAEASFSRYGAGAVLHKKNNGRSAAVNWGDFATVARLRGHPRSFHRWSLGVNLLFSTKPNFGSWQRSLWGFRNDQIIFLLAKHAGLWSQ